MQFSNWHCQTCMKRQIVGLTTMQYAKNTHHNQKHSAYIDTSVLFALYLRDMFPALNRRPCIEDTQGEKNLKPAFRFFIRTYNQQDVIVVVVKITLSFRNCCRDTERTLILMKSTNGRELHGWNLYAYRWPGGPSLALTDLTDLRRLNLVRSHVWSDLTTNSC